MGRLFTGCVHAKKFLFPTGENALKLAVLQSMGEGLPPLRTTLKAPLACRLSPCASAIAVDIGPPVSTSLRNPVTVTTSPCWKASVPVMLCWLPVVWSIRVMLTCIGRSVRLSAWLDDAEDAGRYSLPVDALLMLGVAPVTSLLLNTRPSSPRIMNRPLLVCMNSGRFPSPQGTLHQRLQGRHFAATESLARQSRT